MDSGGPELSLSLKPCYVPQSISNILKDVSKIHNFSDRLLVLNEYLRKYQEELSRLKDLKNELPQCVLLLMDAIEKLEEEVMNIKIGMPAMECLSKKSIEMLRTETFEKYSKDNVFKRPSPQLLESNHGGHQQLSTILGTRRLQPWKAGIGEDAFLRASMAAKAREPGEQIQALNALSSAKWGNQRKSWRQPLHARFMAAVELLGGPEVATPKQIKELMNVEGLTIDHIKSHLQKYRIQMRRAPAASTYHPNRRA